jgi:hypothetical protein
MRKELADQLNDEFKDMFPTPHPKGSPQVPFTLFSWEIGDGWFELVRDALREIKSKSGDKPPKLFQVKEKWGGLRMYMDPYNDDVADVIRLVERKSGEICEQCGEAGELRTDSGWWMTLCDEHNEKNKKEKHVESRKEGK